MIETHAPDRLAAGVPGDARPVELIGEHGDRWFFRFSLPTAHGKAEQRGPDLADASARL